MRDSGSWMRDSRCVMSDEGLSSPDAVSRLWQNEVACVSEIGYGMWGMAGWTGSDDDESRQSLDRAVALGCNFFDTAWAYGDGKSENAARRAASRHPDKRLHVATKIPPKNRQWPARPQFALDDVFPPDYMREYTEISLEEPRRRHDRSSAAPCLDGRMGGRRPLAEGCRLTERRGADSRLRHQHQPLAAGERARRRWRPICIDSVQVVYNVFDQSPEDELFPECERRNIAVIARVPFDEGSLTGTLTPTRLARGRLPQHLFPARESSQYARPSGTSAAAGAGGHESSGAGAASYPADGRR